MSEPLRPDDPAWIFEWLAALFAAPPSPEAVAAHRRGPTSDRMVRLAADPALAAGIAAMRVDLVRPIDDAALTAEFGRTYGRLFEGIGGPGTVAPYESAHRCGGRLFQAPTSEMEALLAAHDLSVSAATAEPADHLAIELALMARFVATDDPARAAMSGRLAGWIPAFAAAVIAADVSPFWAGAARILRAVVERECRDVPGLNQERAFG